MFKGAEGTKINSIRRKAIPDVYNSLSEKCRPYSGVAALFKQFIMMISCLVFGFSICVSVSQDGSQNSSISMQSALRDCGNNCGLVSCEPCGNGDGGGNIAVYGN